MDTLVKVLGAENLSALEVDLDRYSADALSPHRAFRAGESLQRTADVVVQPRSTQQVVEIVKLAAAHRVPIVPYGGGTGVMGAALPVRGGIVVDLKGLNKVLEVSAADMAVTAEAGVVLEDLVKALDPHGLMPGHDPWSVPIATVGGTISTNGVGYRAASHGPMGQQVLGLEVVLPNGEVLSTRAVPKYASGPNLNHLFIGAEGAFGIITKATLRIFRQPEAQSFATFGFDAFDQGFNAVAEMFAMGLKPTLVDLTEESEESVRLYMMYEGYKEGVEARKVRSARVCESFGGRDLGPEETQNYWENRHSSGYWYREAMLDQPRQVRWERRGRSFDYLHMALPVSRVLGYRRQCDAILSRWGLKAVEYAIWTQPELFSLLIVPAGKGRISSRKREAMGDAVDEILSLSQDMGGTMEYCHGVGVKLAHLLPREMGVGLDVAKAIKRALDPHDIMNPGKLF